MIMVFRGSIARLSDSLCTLRSDDYSIPTQHSVPAVGQTFPGGLLPQGAHRKVFDNFDSMSSCLLSYGLLGTTRGPMSCRFHVWRPAPRNIRVNVCFVSCPARSFRFVPDRPPLHFVDRRPASSGRVKNRVKIARNYSGGRTKRPTRTDCSAPGGCFAREQLVCHGCLRRSFLPWPADHFPVS